MNEEQYRVFKAGYEACFKAPICDATDEEIRTWYEYWLEDEAMAADEARRSGYRAGYRQGVDAAQNNVEKSLQNGQQLANSAEEYLINAAGSHADIERAMAQVNQGHFEEFEFDEDGNLLFDGEPAIIPVDPPLRPTTEDQAKVVFREVNGQWVRYIVPLDMVDVVYTERAIQSEVSRRMEEQNSADQSVVWATQAEPWDWERPSDHQSPDHPAIHVGMLKAIEIRLDELYDALEALRKRHQLYTDKSGAKINKWDKEYRRRLTKHNVKVHGDLEERIDRARATDSSLLERIEELERRLDDHWHGRNDDGEEGMIVIY